jgi:DNA-directed RNA polymerase subunit RPC12/RpoP
MTFLQGMFGEKSTFKCHRCPEMIKVPSASMSELGTYVQCTSCGANYLISAKVYHNGRDGILSKDWEQRVFLCDADGTPY